ncbi:hypothetical protein [Rufibacter soli]
MMETVVQRIIDDLSDPLGVNPFAYDFLTKTTLPHTTKLAFTYYKVVIELINVATAKEQGAEDKRVLDFRAMITDLSLRGVFRDL